MLKNPSVYSTKCTSARAKLRVLSNYKHDVCNCPIKAQIGLLIANQDREFCYSFFFSTNIFIKIILYVYIFLRLHKLLTLLLLTLLTFLTILILSTILTLLTMGSRYYQKYKQYKQSRINSNGLNVLCYLAQFTWKWCSYNTVGPVFFGGMGYLIGKWFRQFRNCLAALVETVQRTHD